MWLNKTETTVETNRLKWNVKCFKKNLTAYYLKGLPSLRVWSFHVLVGISHSLPLLQALNLKGRVHHRKKIVNILLLVNPELCSLFSRDDYSERLERSWALFLEKLSTRYWQLARGDFPSGAHSVWNDTLIVHIRHSKQKRHLCFTITFSITVKRFLLLKRVIER